MCPNNVKWCNGPGSFGQLCTKCKSAPAASYAPQVRPSSPPRDVRVLRPSSPEPAAQARPLPSKPPPAASVAVLKPGSPGAPRPTSPPQSPQAMKKVGNFDIVKLLGEGSYKKAYTTNDPATVVIVTSNPKQLKAEIDCLRRLGAAGIRVVELRSPIYELPDGTCAVAMENLHPGLEVKETRFRIMKREIIETAKAFGIAEAIEQLARIDAFVQQPNHGISDLQFVISKTKGFVLFDPATIGTSEKNGGPADMIKLLKKEAQE